MTATESARASWPREQIAKVLGCLSLAVWLAFIGLFEHYSDTRPTVSEQSKGRVYAQNNHGHVTYLTANEQSRLELLEFSAPVLFVAAALADPRQRIWHWRK